MSTAHTVGGIRAKRNTVETYLREQVRAGSHYHRPRFIADELPLSTHEIDAVISVLQQTSDVLDVRRWGYADEIIWQVSLRDPM